jgi:hypothetical protein
MSKRSITAAALVAAIVFPLSAFTQGDGAGGRGRWSGRPEFRGRRERKRWHGGYERQRRHRTSTGIGASPPEPPR